MKILRKPKDDTIEKARKCTRKTILSIQACCPFCGTWREEIWEDDGVGHVDLHKGKVSVCYLRYRWYGQKSGRPYWFKWGKDLKNWEFNVYECEKCGAKWQGDTYSVDEV